MADSRVTVPVGGDTSQLEAQLLVIAKHATACAEELALLRTTAEEVRADG